MSAMDQHTLRGIAAISDPIERVRAVGKAMAEQQGAVTELASIRRHAIAQARDSGMTLEQIGSKLGVSGGRVSQLASAGASARAPAQPQRTAPRVLVQRALPTDPAVRGSKSLFLEEAERQGITGERRMLYIGTEVVGDHIASALRIDPGTEAIARRKMFTANSVPVRIATSYFRTAEFAGTRIAEAEFVLPTLQAALESLGYTFGYAKETLTARQATRFEAETLELDPGEWVIQVLRASYSTEDTPVHVLETVCSANRHIFVIGQATGADQF
ncbi:MAG: putative transcriptional regulator, GntR family [Streptosporangiaceae bacterium]|nr:putative transcriptional regulator, GntR family [Streptosporangiaceae bacterium]